MHSLMKFWEYRRQSGSWPETAFEEVKTQRSFDESSLLRTRLLVRVRR
jgi:hypothetical protein